MSYSDFTLRKVKQTFGINTIEDQKFLPEIKPIAASATLTDFLAESLPLEDVLKGMISVSTIVSPHPNPPLVRGGNWILLFFVRSPFPIPHSPFPIPCSLLPPPYSLFPVPCSLI
ncbi:hypothetical protein IM676_02580 [Anabaenopsis elenkinii CCIBt3563]|uniref:Uncharacterized protein n=1 Tax=Anabaenopsis elenkinii CCIBt3563 TaxID=2779889 RepID=A0A7S6U5R6_9CYAN|nr:hypothetical protein IM676_02580 [Anabaenopsis elenkinii CCIBt3563]